MKVAQFCRTLCDPMDYAVNGIPQTRILELVAFPFSSRSSQPRDQTQVSHIAGGFFTSWATREALVFWTEVIFFLSLQGKRMFHAIWCSSLVPPPRIGWLQIQMSSPPVDHLSIHWIRPPPLYILPQLQAPRRRSVGLKLSEVTHLGPGKSLLKAK